MAWVVKIVGFQVGVCFVNKFSCTVGCKLHHYHSAWWISCPVVEVGECCTIVSITVTFSWAWHGKAWGDCCATVLGFCSVCLVACGTASSRDSRVGTGGAAWPMSEDVADLASSLEDEAWVVPAWPVTLGPGFSGLWPMRWLRSISVSEIGISSISWHNRSTAWSLESFSPIMTYHFLIWVLVKWWHQLLITHMETLSPPMIALLNSNRI